MEEECGDLLWSQSDAIELVDIVEDGKVLSDRADLAGSCSHTHSQLFLSLPCVFWRVGTRITKLGQSDAAVAAAIGILVVKKGSHLFPSIFSLTGDVIYPGTITASFICEVTECVTEIAPISLQILSYALEAVFVVFCVLPLFQF